MERGTDSSVVKSKRAARRRVRHARVMVLVIARMSGAGGLTLTVGLVAVTTAAGGAAPAGAISA